MLRLSLKTLADPKFMSAINALCNSREVDEKTAYRAGRIAVAGKREMEKLVTHEEAIRAKYTMTVTEGDKSRLEWKEPGAAEKANAEFADLLEGKEVDIKVHKLDFGSVKGLTGAEMIALEPVMDNIPEEA